MDHAAGQANGKENDQQEQSAHTFTSFANGHAREEHTSKTSRGTSAPGPPGSASTRTAGQPPPEPGRLSAMPPRPSLSAEVVCYLRACETLRPSGRRIVDDPYARLFLGPAFGRALGLGPRAVAWPPLASLATYIAARHRLIDDHLARALTDDRGPIQRLVLLGAGYDSRAHRLRGLLAGRPTLELDLAATARRKQRIIARQPDRFPPAPVVALSIDFARQSLASRLVDGGLDPARPAFFIWEGVTMYLPRPTVEGTLGELRAVCAAGSLLALDCWSPGPRSLRRGWHRASARLLHLLGEPIRFELHPEELGAFVDPLGFEVVDLADAAELQRRVVPDRRRVYDAVYVALLRAR
jgi:methyltransferase (TIGR00027 family)